MSDELRVDDYGDGDEEEIVFLDPGQEPPDEGEDDEEAAKKVEETEELRRQIEELKGKDQGAALSEGLKELAQSMNRSPHQQTVSPQQPGETEEQFLARIEDQVFQPKKTAATLREVVNRYAAPYVQQLAQNNVELSKKVLELDPEKGKFFRQYKDEVEEFVQGLPPQNRMNPQVYEYALREVMGKHPEIEEERLNAKVEERVKQILKERGLDEESESSSGAEGGSPPHSRKRTFTEGSGVSSKASVRGKRKAQYVKAEDRQQLANEAALYGMDLETYLREVKGR